MRAVIQRVDSAEVAIDNTLHAAIGAGLLVLVGIEAADNRNDADWLAGKIARLRIFDDAQGVMNLAVSDTGGEILVISQFTLHASTKKGNRPSYIRAAGPGHATALYEYFKQAVERESQRTVKSGIFGALMKISLTNNGPVTIIMDTQAKE